MNDLDKIAVGLLAAVTIIAAVLAWAEVCHRIRDPWGAFAFWTPFTLPVIWAVAYVAWRVLGA